MNCGGLGKGTGTGKFLVLGASFLAISTKNQARRTRNSFRGARSLSQPRPIKVG
jgi:hypothetical protein